MRDSSIPTALDDPQRLAALRRLQRPDDRAVRSLDRLSRLAARLLHVPAAVVSLIDSERQIFFGAHGLPDDDRDISVPAARSFCSLVVAAGEPVLIGDAREDERFLPQQELVRSGAVAYAGVPLRDAEGHVLGTFSVVDGSPRSWSAEDVSILEDLAASAWTEIELRQELLERQHAEAQRAAAEERSERILQSIGDAFFVLDGEWRFTYANRGAEQMLDRPRAELIGRSIWDLFPEAIGSIFQTEYERAVKTRVSVVFEAYSERHDLWGLVHAYPLEEGLSIYITDISERKAAEQRTAEAEAHYRRLVTAVPLGVYVVDELGRFTEVNPALERLLGRSAEELLGRESLSMIHPADRDAVVAIFRDVIQGRRDGVEFQSRILLPGGGERTMDATVTAVVDGGRIAGIHGVARDVTDQWYAELALRESEEKLRQIAENVREVFWVFTPDFSQALYVSPAYETIWGRPVADLESNPRAFLEAVHEADRERLVEAIRQRWEVDWEGVQCRVVRPDGTVRWISARGSPVLDENGRIFRLVGTAEDITQVREREEARMLLAAALDGLGEGVCLMTPSGEYVYCNRAHRQIFGLDPDGPGAASMAELAHDEETVRFQRQALRTAMEQGRWAGRVVRRRRATGEEFPADILIGRVDGSEVPSDLLFGIVRDATEEVEREQQLRLLERMSSVGTLVGGVAHELNNPLSAVLNFAQLLAMDEADPERRDDLITIQREAERMAKIVNDLKQIARTAREEKMERAPVDLNEVVEHVMKVQDYRFRTSNVEVRLDLARSLPELIADRAQMEQVVLNLVVNAEQAMAGERGEGLLVIRTRRTGTGIALHVVDDGPGIPPSLLQRVFDPFFTTKSPGEGTGLGLSLVHSIVTEHGGEVRVESQVGAGTAFRVDLPAARRAGPSTATLPDLPEPPRESLRILVVDDEDAIRRVLVRHLSRRGHRVDEAPEGTVALELVTRHPYDVILTDLRMPGLGGEALLEELRARESTARVIFMTGDASGGARGATMHAVPVLLKPAKLEEVTRLVEEGSDR